jgi:hypothetical protein
MDEEEEIEIQFNQAYSRKDDSSYGTVATNESMSGTSSSCKPVKL